MLQQCLDFREPSSGIHARQLAYHLQFLIKFVTVMSLLKSLATIIHHRAQCNIMYVML